MKQRRCRQDRLIDLAGWLAYAVGSFAVGIAVGQVVATTVEPSRAAVIFSAAIGGVVVWLLREIFKPI